MAGENILTRLKSKQTGDEFIIPYYQLREKVMIYLYAPTEVDWSSLQVMVSDETSGNIEYYHLNSRGECSFFINYGNYYKVFCPDIDTFFTPTFAFTAQEQVRNIRYTYYVEGVFGMDAQGNKYTIEQIEALPNKDIIKYAGYNDQGLATSSRKDGGIGNGFFFDINAAIESMAWASSDVEFSQELLPFCSSNAAAYVECAGLYNTLAMNSEAERLGITSPAAIFATSRTVDIAGVIKMGFVPAYGQIKRLTDNITQLQNLFNVLGKTAPAIKSGIWCTSCQGSATNAVSLDGGFFNYRSKANSRNVLCCFDL
jgi:hypothetical protein